jgi:hypothetical protein
MVKYLAEDSSPKGSSAEAVDSGMLSVTYSFGFSSIQQGVAANNSTESRLFGKANVRQTLKVERA